MVASTYDFTNGSVQGQIRPINPPIEPREITPISNVVDFSQQSLDAGEGDIAQVLPIPAKTIVLFVTVLPKADADGSLAASNATVDVGYGGSTAKWGSGIVLDTAEFNVAATGGVAPTLAPHYFASADTIDLVATTDDGDVDISAGMAEVTAYCVKPGP